MRAKNGFNLEAGLISAVYKGPWESKKFIQINWTHIDDHMKAFKVGAIPGIVSFNVTLTSTHTQMRLSKPYFKPDFDHPLLSPYQKILIDVFKNLVPNQIGLPGKFDLKAIFYF